MRRRGCAALVAALITTAACWAPPLVDEPGGPFVVEVVSPDDGPSQIQVSGWSSDELTSLRRANLTEDGWTKIVSLHVADNPSGIVASTYTVHDDRLDVTPRFGLDPGRGYQVKIDGAHPPLSRQTPVYTTTISLPAEAPTPPVRVTGIYPSGSTWPENTLRFYLHFSGPMSATSAVGHVRLLDAAGQVVDDVLLDVDVDLWNTDYTRRTVFFDPGRVKKDIRPNRELGRALVAGRRYAIAVEPAWPDGKGRPLAAPFRHEFAAGRAVERGLEPNDWTISSPGAGTRDPLSVSFPWPLDAGLLERAVGVTTGDGTPVDGRVDVGANETSWTFTPERPWASQQYLLVVLSVLEDPSGNTVREPFEFEMFGKPKPATPERLTYPFTPQ
jgi:hypothetical protein